MPHGTETTSQQVDNEATDTMNPHAKCAGPTRPVETPHEPANKWFDKQEGGRMAKAESVSTPIEGWSGQMPIDHTDDAKSLGDDPSDMAEESQGVGMGSKRGSDKTDTSGVSGNVEDVKKKPKKLSNASELGICMGIPRGTAGHTRTCTRGKSIPTSGIWVSAVGYEKWTRGTTHGGSYPWVSCI